MIALSSEDEEAPPLDGHNKNYLKPSAENISEWLKSHGSSISGTDNDTVRAVVGPRRRTVAEWMERHQPQPGDWDIAEQCHNAAVMLQSLLSS